MNAAQREAIRTAIGNAEDNLMRARMQRNVDPEWTTGDGQTIDTLIEGYERQLAELKDGFE